MEANIPVMIRAKGVTVLCVRACGHGRAGHPMSCRLVSPRGVQMACDYVRLSRDYCAAQTERESQK